MNLNEKIILFLSEKNIICSADDFRTEQQDGQEDEIVFWNYARLGSIPSKSDLDSVVERSKINIEKYKLYSLIIECSQQRLDDFARTRNYDGILSACTYATSTVPKFAAEGQYCVEARDATWAKLYAIMAEVEAGTRPLPAGFSDVEPDLPVLAWPV